MRQFVAVGILSLLTLVASFSGASAAEKWDGRIFVVKNQTEISAADFAAQMARYETIIMGEKHYTSAVQTAEARIIDLTVNAAGVSGRFTTAWEFLNYTSRDLVSDLFSKFVAGKITAGDFLLSTQGPMANTYAPVLEMTKKLGGEIFAPNLSSKEKAPVVKGGIAAADPAFVPPGFALGGAYYKERFIEAMGGHASPDQIDNYFAAQSLTDDFMAYRIAGDIRTPLKFMVVGSFHTDYLDGFVARLQVRAPKTNTVTIKIIDASDFTQNELLPSLKHARYGDIADYVYFVNEPKASAE